MKSRPRILIAVLLLAATVPAAAAESVPVKLAEEEPQWQGGQILLTGDAETDVNLIHSGDKLKIEVFREPDLTGMFVVDDNGKISYPLLGEIFVEGLSREELREYLAETLGADFIVAPQITIDFAESPNKSVAILGQVTKPGNYILTSNSTLVRLISQVGGFSANASTDNVKVVRTEKGGKKSSQIVNVGRIMNGEEEDFLLKPGDLIFVERLPEESKDQLSDPEKVVTILGQVNKPGNYYLTENISLIRLVAQAGGFTQLASTHNVRIVRSKEGSERTFHVDVGLIMSGRAEDIKLEAGDLLVVQESYF
jgi:polysaccharide biosynthesis/export protein